MAISTKPGSAGSGNRLQDLLEHGLKDMYHAEGRILESLERMIEAAEDEDLRAALSTHRGETKEQIRMLERAFEALDLPAGAGTCDAMDGILAEGDRLLADFGGTPVGDAAIIFSAQAVEHYEIARYGSLRSFAELLALDEVADLMQQILDQELATDERLTEIAEDSANPTAADVNDEDGDEDA